MDFGEIKRRADCLEVAAALGMEIRNGRCRAEWRDGDGFNVSLSQEAFCDFAPKGGPAGGSCIDLVALVRFGWDGQDAHSDAIQKAAEWLTNFYGIDSAKKGRRQECRTLAPVAKSTGTAAQRKAKRPDTIPHPAPEEATAAATAPGEAPLADTSTLAPEENAKPRRQAKRLIPEGWPKGEPLTAENRIAFFERLRKWKPGTVEASGGAIVSDVIAWPMWNSDAEKVGFKLRRYTGEPFDVQGEQCKSVTSSLPHRLKGGGHSGLLLPAELGEGQIIICEGEADFCAAISAGQTAIGTSGAKPGEAALALMSNVCESREVFLAPDGDADGEQWLIACLGALKGDGETPGAAAVHVIRHGTRDLDDFLKASDDSTARLAELMASHPVLALDELEEIVSSPKILGGGKAKRKKKKRETIPIPPHLEALDVCAVPSTARPDVTLSSMARLVFEALGQRRELFNRGGVATEVSQSGEGIVLSILKPEALCSRAERHFRIIKTVCVEGQLFDDPATVNKDLAGRLLASLEAQECLPRIVGLSGGPMLARDGRIIGPGYDAESSWYVTGGTMPPVMDWREGAQALEALLEDFAFPTQGDKARALAGFLTPCMKLNGHIESAPMDISEADCSQSGKTYRVKLTAAIYRETLSLATNRQSGGVGSLEESFNQALVRGRPFILLDNLRGKVASEFLEAFLTGGGTALGARVPYAPEIPVDSNRFHIFGTSNGFEATRDLANRSAIVRIRKQAEGYTFRQWPEGDLLEHVKANQPYFLGAVFAVVKEWIRQGKQRTDETRHDFRQWAQSLDWISQTLFCAGPLLDGHNEARLNASNATLSFLRLLAFAVARQGRLGEPLTASDIIELAGEEELEVPGAPKHSNLETAALQNLGRKLGPVFRHSNAVTLEEFRIFREERGSYNSPKMIKTYTFERLGA